MSVLPQRIFPSSWFRALAVPAVLVSFATTEAEESGFSAEKWESDVFPLLETYCVECHGGEKIKGDLDLKALVESSSIIEQFRTWELVAEMLEFEDMPPPEESNQPSERERSMAIETIGSSLEAYMNAHAGDPGEVRLRRLTSAEYAYTIRDLTGLDLDLAGEFPEEAVGGEGFSNVGTVQFMQDSTLERYLAVAKRVASHAVVGAGPLQFYEDPGMTGQELSAINRIRAIYREHGFRTGAGEGALAYGVEMYERGFFAAWKFRHRFELGLGEIGLETLAAEEGISATFLKNLWETLDQANPSFPTRSIVDAWNRIPEPESIGDVSYSQIREECTALYQYLLDWQKTLAAGSQDDEEYPVLTDDPFVANDTHSFSVGMNLGNRSGPLEFEIRVKLPDAEASSRPAVVWKNPRMQILRKGEEETIDRPLRELVVTETARRLRFGVGLEGARVDPDDFVSNGGGTIPIRVNVPYSVSRMRFLVDAVLDMEMGDDCLTRVEVTDGASEGETIASTGAASALLSNPNSPQLEEWSLGIRSFARTLPQVSHREATPSDRDWIPEPFDNTYNTAERNYFHTAVKYHRDDAFLSNTILDTETATALDQAWTDLLTAFDYHDTIFRFSSKKYAFEIPGNQVSAASADWARGLNSPEQEIVASIVADYASHQERLRDAEKGHLEEVFEFAERAWRRPLRENDIDRLAAFYSRLRTEKALAHADSVRATLTRVLVAPEFLYRIERPSGDTPIVALTDYQLASRLSYFLWSSKPDATLLAAAERGELSNPDQLTQQANRMLKDPRSRRLATEFFGQWFGFYRFDGYTGIDSSRFAFFDDELKSSLYEESIRFFESLIVEDRPVDDMLFADYTFLNERLADHYGIPFESRSEADGEWARMESVRDYQRGGLLRLGSVLAVTSAPLRTSAVKRGDWILRRVLGTPTPPPPADAGSIPAEEVLSDGKTVRERLEAHRSDASCVNCHRKIDPLGFALEQFDPVGQWRDAYADGGRIDTTGVLDDGTEIIGYQGLEDYLRGERALYRRNLCRKLLGYALGRSELASDRLLIDKMLESLDADNRFSTLVALIVSSDQFRNQRGPALDSASVAMTP